MYILSAIDTANLSKIKINKNMTLGRGDTNDIIIDNSSVSTNHAKIYIENEKIYLQDLNSTNGTFIGEHKLDPDNKYELKEKQVIKFAEVSFILEYENSQSSNKEEFIVGRDPKADIFINSDTVSFHHLKVIKEQNIWYLLDNASMNGTYLNSYDNPIDKIKLEKDQVLYLASYKLNTNEIFNLFDESKSLEKLINKDITLIGRDPKSDIHINNLNVSWNHAKIVRENSSYYIYDLNSTNGTFVNDMSVDEHTIINRGDKITLGVYSFVFQENKEENLSLLNISRKGFTIDAKNVSFVVNIGTAHEKTLLNRINFTVYPGEMVGLMGLSGAGKTTLLKILSGYTQPTEGQVFINGLDLYKNFERIKNSIGYVPQEDIIHPELTVYEALLYSFKLRLKEDLSIEEIDKKIYIILKELGLPVFEEKNHKDDIRTTKIGDANDKGISGGQRKRVNIAMELLADPEIIFLDEPTSGLSSVDAKIVMEKLKKLSDDGKTIILTIHQPSLVNYKKMDDVIILSTGELAYFGPNYPESIKFFNDNTTSQEILSDPDMALLGLHDGEQKNINWRDKYESSDIYDKFVNDRASQNNYEGGFDSDNTPSSLRQFKTLTSRYLNIKIKDRVNTAILLLQAPTIGILLAFLFSVGAGQTFHEEHPSILLFILVLSSMWFGIINSVKEIVGEKAIYERERLIGLKLMPYILSKFMVLALLSLIQVLVLIGIVKFSIKLEVHIIDLISIIFFTALIGLSIGLFISTIAKSVSQALSLVPIVLLPMIIFGGGMIPIKDLPTNKYYLDAYRVSFVMPTRWVLEESIRIFDREYDDSSTPLREPIIDENGTKIFLNEDFRGSTRDIAGDIVCEDRRCIESLYMKSDTDNRLKGKWIDKSSSTTFIYFIIGLFILVPLGLVLLLLYRRDKK